LRVPTARQVLEAVQAGADVRQSSRAGVTPMMIAAASNPDPAVITILLAAGAAVDERDWVGATALICAARFNPRDARAVSAGGETAFSLASKNPHLRGSEVLVALRRAAR
jgi:uncharacterized protein